MKNNYEPFGNEWKAEIKKWNKNSLIEFLRKTLMELQEVKNISSKQVVSGSFIFTPENLLDNLEQLGAWSSYGLASSALQHYFPEEYEDESASTEREVELLAKLGGTYWQDAIIKYHKEIGYKPQVLSNTDYVNAY